MRPSDSGSNPVNVQLDGTTIYTFTDVNTASWTNYSTALTILSGGTHTITFSGTNTASDVSVGLDNVSLGGTGLSATSPLELINAGTSLDVADNNAAIGSLSGVDGSTVTLGNGTLRIGGDNTSTNFAGSISDSGGVSTNTGGSIVKVGAGTLTLSGSNNSYSGTTTLTGGTLSLGSAFALGSTSSIIFNGGTLQFTAANANDYSGLFSTADNQAYSIDTNGQDVTFNSPLSSNGGTLTKSGAGSLTLTADSNYTGATTLNGGTLRANNFSGSATGTGNVTLNSGTFATGNGFGGDGSIAGSILAGTGPHVIAPGGVGTMGTLSVGGGITTNANTTFDFDLGNPVSGGFYSGDLIDLTGTSGLTVGAGTQITFGSNPTQAGEYRLFEGSNLGSTALREFHASHSGEQHDRLCAQFVGRSRLYRLGRVGESFTMDCDDARLMGRQRELDEWRAEFGRSNRHVRQRARRRRQRQRDARWPANRRSFGVQ